MLRYREYAEYTTTRQSRFWTAFANALGFVVLPPIRLLCRVFPPLRRAVNNTPGGRMGAAFRARERGDHRGAFLTAMEGLGKCRFATDMDPGEFMADLNWWMFMNLASTEALKSLGLADGPPS